MLTLLVGALVTWITTFILVESELFRPVRDRCPDRLKLRYLVGCHLCAGTWIGLGVGFILPLPIDGAPFMRGLLSGLAFKGLAHVILAVQNRLDPGPGITVHVLDGV